MVYSGHIVFYGIKFDNIQLLEYFLKRFLNVPIAVKQIIFLASAYDEKCQWYRLPRDIVNMILEMVEPELPEIEDPEDVYEISFKFKILMKEHGYILDLDYKKCCYNDGTLFLGTILGNLNIVYRSEVESYKNFADYQTSVMEQFDRIRKANKQIDHSVYRKIQKVLDRSKTCQNCKENEHDICDCDLDLEVQVYTYADDCESCS